MHALWSKELAQTLTDIGPLDEGWTTSGAVVEAVEFVQTVRVRVCVRAHDAPPRSGRLHRAAEWGYRVVEKFGTMFAIRPAPVAAWPELTAATASALAGGVEVILRRRCGDVVISATAEAPAAPPARRSPTPWDRLAPLLGAVATSLGVIGFVTFVGGVIAWARVKAGGLPPAPTLGILPRQDLLVIGAETLVPMVALGVVVVVILAALYGCSRGLVQQSVRRHWLDAHERAFLAGEAGLLATTGMILSVLFTSGAILVWRIGELHAGQVLRAMVGVLLATVIAGLIGSVTSRFVYLAVTAFLVVGMFVGVLAYWRAGNEERVRGAAVWRKDRRAIYGIFVAENGARVYLAQFSRPVHGKVLLSSSRLVGIAKADVLDIAIADREPLALALEEAKGLAGDLCAQRPPGGGYGGCVIDLPARRSR